MNQYTYIDNEELNVIVRTDQNGVVSAIPKDLANADYQEYLNPKTRDETPTL